MSDITINNNENQEDNQKTTPAMKSLSEPNDSSLALSGEIFSTWLGLKDGNITFSDELNFDPAKLDAVYEDDHPGLSQ